VRSDNGPEFIAKNLMKWFKQLEVQPLFIEPGSPWENGYCESFNGKVRYELLNGEIFFSLREAQVVIETWRRHYNTVRPGKPVENAYIESLDGRFRDECLNEHWFVTLREAQVRIEAWREDYNHNRPHSSLGDLTSEELAKTVA
jgi:transposase InsO family protein